MFFARQFVMRTPTLLVSLLATFAFGCGSAASDDEDDGKAQGALGATDMPACASWGGLENFDGLPGTYAFQSTSSGVTSVPNEMRKVKFETLTPNPQHISSAVEYAREACSSGTCKDEKGSAQVLPENAAMNPMITFMTHDAITRCKADLAAGNQESRACVEAEVYFVYGIRRTGPDVAEICLGNVRFVSDGSGEPFTMRRVEEPAR